MLWAVCNGTAALAAMEPADSAASTLEPDTRHLTLQEVTVTAIKQTSDLRTQATAVTTIGRKEIERNHIVSTKTAACMVPNFFIPDYGSRMTSTIYVRGLGARIDQPAMGLNIDNIPIMCKENYDVDMLDISRIEMLRGPQSTLYGRNAMGGLMNVYTLSPLSYQGTRLLAEYGSHNAVKLGASTYNLVSDHLGLSGSFYYTSTDGEFRNDYNGKKVDWEHQGSLRLKADWQVSPSMHIANVLSGSTSRQGGYPYEYTATGKIAYNDTCFYKRTSVLDGLTVEKRFDTFTLSSITSYQYIDDNMTLDQDFTPDPYFTLTQKRRENAITQDLIARHKSNGYECITGVFGFYRHYNMDAPVTFKDTGIARLIEEHVNAATPSYPVAWDSREFVLGSNFKNDNWGTAFYHQSSYDWHNFTVAAGARVDYEKSTLRYHSHTATGYSIVDAAAGTLYAHEAVNIDESGKLHKDFLQVLPKISLTYRLHGKAWHTIYASVAKGYKAGGFNTQMFSDVLQQKLMRFMGIGSSYDIDKIVGYKPEKAWNYELGGHFECWEQRVKSDIDVFYLDCRDRQLTVFPDGTTTGRVMTNAGKTRSWGAEVTMTVTPWANTGLTVNYGYCNAKFRNYNDGKADYKGNYVPYSPSNTLYVDAYHTIDLDRGSKVFNTLTLDANMSAAGPIYWNEANSLKQPFYALLGASATLAGQHYSLEVWGRNLTDTKYSTFYFVSIKHEFLQRGRGFALGATLRVNL